MAEPLIGCRPPNSESGGLSTGWQYSGIIRNQVIGNRFKQSYLMRLECCCGWLQRQNMNLHLSEYTWFCPCADFLQTITNICTGQSTKKHICKSLRGAALSGIKGTQGLATSSPGSQELQKSLSSCIISYNCDQSILLLFKLRAALLKKTKKTHFYCKRPQVEICCDNHIVC